MRDPRLRTDIVDTQIGLAAVFSTAWCVAPTCTSLLVAAGLLGAPASLMRMRLRFPSDRCTPGGRSSPGS